MSQVKTKVEIPRDVEGSLALGSKIYKKHTDDGESSPLRLLADYNWETEGPKVKACLDKHEEAEELKRRAEQAYKDRDAMLLSIKAIIRASRDMLEGMFPENVQKLSDWGFDLNSSPSGGTAKNQAK